MTKQLFQVSLEPIDSEGLAELLKEEKICISDIKVIDMQKKKGVKKKSYARVSPGARYILVEGKAPRQSGQVLQCYQQLIKLFALDQVPCTRQILNDYLVEHTDIKPSGVSPNLSTLIKQGVLREVKKDG
jgi:hypothetical protein